VPIDPALERRFSEEVVIWLTTVDPDGTPEPSPVWFWWSGSEFIIYSYENVPRVRNVERHPPVSLHLNTTPTGSGVVAITGRAEIDPTQPPAHENPGYAAKYRDGIARKGGEAFSRLYVVPLRVTPLLFRVQGERGWTFTDGEGRTVRTRATGTSPSARIPMKPPGPA